MHYAPNFVKPGQIKLNYTVQLWGTFLRPADNIEGC